MGLRRLSALTSLELRDVSGMSDAVLASSVTALTRLTSLSVTHCKAVTADGRALVLAALGPAVALEFEGCSVPDVTAPKPGRSGSAEGQLLMPDMLMG